MPPDSTPSVHSPDPEVNTAHGRGRIRANDANLFQIRVGTEEVALLAVFFLAHASHRRARGRARQSHHFGRDRLTPDLSFVDELCSFPGRPLWPSVQPSASVRRG